MKIEDYDSVCDAASPADIEAALRKRHGDGINAFWLSHGSRLHPVLSILVKGDLAYLLYIPNEDHPGFTSVSELPVARPHETTVFFVTPNEKAWIVNGAVVPFSDALRVAQEFAISAAMPRSMRWFEL
jgi:hypothetical protein